MSDTSPHAGDEHPTQRRIEGRPWARRAVTIPILLDGAQRVVQISGEFPLTQAQWDHLMACLEAMQPGLVEEQALPASSDPVTHATGG